MSQLQRNKRTLPLGHTVEGNKLVALDGFNFERHKHIIGISGSGKSSFIASIVVFLLRLGIAFCLIDPHGDLATLIVSLLASSDFYTNPRAYDRLWLVDYSRADAAIAWNVLKQDHIDNYKVASNIVEAIHRAFPTSSGSTTALDNTIEYSAFVLAENGLPLTQLQRFLLDSALRNNLLRNIKDQQILQFFDFQFTDKINTQLISSTMRRLDLLTFSPSLRAALGQRQNKLNFRYLMDNNISCIINLNGLTDAEKRLAGCLLTVELEQAFLSRATMPVDKRTPYHVIIDEFPLFSVSDKSFSVILEQVRKYGGTLYLAHQTISQMSKDIVGSLQNAISILFKLGYEDSTWAAQRFVRKQDEQSSSLIDWVLGKKQETSPFEQTTSTIEAKQIFESLARQEAIITINNQAQRIRTLTIPSVKVDPHKLAEIENTYARLLLTPLSQMEREQKGSHLILLASVPPLARRVLLPGTNEVKPFTLVSGDFDTDILSCLYHFHYCLLSHLSALLGKKKSENYLRDKKLKQLIAAGLVETSQLARSSAGRPATVYYLSALGLKQITDTLDLPVPIQPGTRKHLFLEHSLDCTDVLLAALEVQQVEKAITILDLKHEQTLKTSPLQVGSHRFVVPDGFLRIRANKPFGVGDDLGIVQEIDRNSEGREKWQQKIEAYKLISPAAFDGLSSITIAVVVTSGGSDRRNTLIEWSREVMKNHAVKDLLVFSVPSSITPQLYLSPEFVTLDNHPCALVEKVS